MNKPGLIALLAVPGVIVLIWIAFVSPPAGYIDLLDGMSITRHIFFGKGIFPVALTLSSLLALGFATLTGRASGGAT